VNNIKSANRRARGNARRIAAACTIPAMVSTILLQAPVARAEEAGDQLEEVIVTGIRHSIEASAEVKKVTDSIVEVATAEDIGKLPGVSIAETLARLPGVAAQRVDGRAQSISIRGMGPEFSVTLLNGQEMVSSGDDRSFEYDQFPAELVTTVTVYKTPDASLASNGLAGTVNISTVSPLTATGQKFNVSARLEDNSYGKLIPGTSATGNRLSASYIDRFADDTFGVALGLVHLDTPTNKKYFNPYDFGHAGDLPVVGIPADQLVYDGFETGVMNWKGVRDSAMAVLEFKPNDVFSSKVNIFHTQFNQDMNGRELAGVIADWGLGNITPTVTQNNGVNGLVVDNVAAVVTMRGDHRKDKIDQATWGNSLQAGAWSLGLDLGASKGTRTQRTSEAYAATKTPITLDATLRSGFNDWGSITSSYDFSNPANFDYATFWWGGGGGYVQEGNIDDKMHNARLTAKRDLDWAIFSSIEGGLMYSHREKAVHYLGYNMLLANPDQSSTCIHYYSWDPGSGCAPIPANILQSPVNLGFAGIPGLISFNVDDALAGSAFIKDTNISRNPSWNWDVQEKITTAYLKTALKFELGIPFHGNLGVQVVRSDQSSTGTQDDGAGGSYPVHGGATYTDVLPSLNLVGDFGRGTLLKVGVAKVLQRPELIYMQANFTAGVGQTDRLWAGSGGNPALRPWRANEFDISLEKYYAPGTYVALATFYKQITSGIYVKSIPYDFTGFTNTTPVLPISNIGILSAPANTNGGHVSGWELSGSLELSAITPALKGFGFTGSLADTKSNLPGTDIYGNVTSTPLPGLSGTVYDLSAFYENSSWQFRIGNRYRSEFVAKRHNSFKNVVDTIRPENIVDAQLGYTFRSGALNDLNILLQVNNLTDAAYVTTQTVAGVEALQNRHTFGRQYLLGASYKF
jgi:iron complex outermembrane recepter protein